MRISSLTGLILASLVFSAAGIAEETDPAWKEVILEKIRAKTKSHFEAYEGVEAQRHIISQQYNSKTDELIGDYEVWLVRTEYYHKKASYRVLKFVKNGRLMSPSDYNYRTREPPHLPFQGDNDLHYEERITGIARRGGEQCYEVEIIPKKKTARHMRGRAYFSVKGLDLLYIEGGLASHPLGVKRVEVKLHFKKLGDASVASHGTYIFEVHIPLFYPHRRFVHSFSSSGERLIPVR